MNRHASKGLPTVVLCNDGWMHLYNQKGQLIDTCGLRLRVTDSADGGAATVVVTGLCNIAGSVEEMEEFYNTKSDQSQIKPDSLDLSNVKKHKPSFWERIFK